MSPDVASAAIRGLAFALLFQACGAVFFLALFGRMVDRSARPIRRLALTAALCGCAVVGIHLLLDASRMTGEYAGMFDTDMQRFALATPGAVARMLQMAALLAIAYGVWKWPSAGGPTALMGALIAVAAFLLAGHTATHPWRPILAPLLLVHLLVVAYWFGSLLPLYLALRRESASVAAEVVAAFSRRALWLVPVLALAGIALVLGIARGLPRFDEPYGALILAKSSAFAVLMGIAGLNKLRLVPALARGQQSARIGLQASIAIEAAILVGVLATSAVLTTFYSP